LKTCIGVLPRETSVSRSLGPSEEGQVKRAKVKRAKVKRPPTT
jgi:hypothetical protein